ncbi:MAG: GDP-mannose 4,6-dehydratase [Spirochaetes bacterium]|nr:GDP-mannose 4,6-dehydratase [Spirochaetota bacterium]
MKKYLITGAMGFAAYYFLDYLNSLQEKCDVLCIYLDTPVNMDLYDFPYLQMRFAKIDLLNYAAIEHELVSFFPTHIVHLASFSSVAKSWHDPAVSFKNNTNIFINLAEIIRTNNIPCKMLSVGSSEEYGNVPVECIPIKESMPLQPINPYAVARVAQEMMALCYASSYKLNIVLTRSFNHIGPRQRDIFVIPSFVKQVLANMKSNKSSEIKLLTGDISLIRDFIDVRDVVKAYYSLLEKGVSGEIYNICSGKGHSIKSIIDMLSDLLEVKISTAIDEKKIRPNDNKIIIGDNSKIVMQTGWEPKIQITDSLRDVIDYWKQR